MRRASAGSVIIENIFSFLTIFAGIVTFFIGLAVGLYVLVNASAAVIMLVWDGVVAGFLFLWMIELLVELQRSELLSLDKFLHLPVSLSGAFLINYLTSLFSFSVIVFLPAMIGLSIGLVFSKGTIMLSLFPVVAGFFLMVTALTHQFRGWLASLMENKRRRRTIITVITIAFALVFQLPNILNFTRFGGMPSIETARAMQEETSKVDRSLAAGEIDRAEHERQVDAIRKKYGGRRQDLRARLQETVRTGRIANMVIPLGWLPYGALTSAEGRILPSMLAALALALIGAASLRRSYGTTMRLYTGQFTARKPAAVSAEVRQDNVAGSASSVDKARASAALLEKQLPWISEHASAIALACFRSLMRAPESKMMLLTPLIFTVVFGSTFLRVHSNPSEFLRPLMVASAMGMILLGLIQLAGNQFGFDRGGFRVFMLAPASRKDILLGKNLALLPIALGLGAIAAAALQLAYPMRIDHFLAVLVQMVSMYLVFCVVTNFLSMLAPTAMASGSLKPVRPGGVAILLHLVFFFVLLPVAMSLTLIPLGIEFLLNWLGVLPYLPLYLLLALAELALTVFLYPQVLILQGRLLQAREQKILEIVTAQVE
jgi:hypothetical protein